MVQCKSLQDVASRDRLGQPAMHMTHDFVWRDIFHVDRLCHRADGERKGQVRCEERGEKRIQSLEHDGGRSVMT